MAIGVAKAFQDAGKTIPGDISLAGFDDSVIGKYYTPSLTTVRVPIDEMMQDAIKILLHPDESVPSSHQGTLVSRDSVTPQAVAV